MRYSTDKLAALRARWTTPKGKDLLRSIKRTRAFLNPLIYREKIKQLKFSGDPEVRGSVDLRGANLAGYDFRSPIKEGDESISDNVTILSKIHFEGANLKHCTFDEGRLHDCNFTQADISHSEFKSSNLNNCSFTEAEASGINLRGAKLINCSFVGAEIRDITLDTTIVDQKTTFGKRLKSEEEGNYHFASIEYKQIKEMYKNSSLHYEADNYHYKEMVAKRKIEPVHSPIRWMNFFFGDLLCRYGTSFTRVLGWSFALILGCALLLNHNGSIVHQNGAPSNSFFDALYFSIVTFTTLGYGDYHAVGAMRFVAAGEAFIGAALMALFTVIVARNIIRD